MVCWVVLLQNKTYLLDNALIINATCEVYHVSYHTKGRHFLKELILMTVRWYVAYSLSYRDIDELMA